MHIFFLILEKYQSTRPIFSTAVRVSTVVSRFSKRLSANFRQCPFEAFDDFQFSVTRKNEDFNRSGSSAAVAAARVINAWGNGLGAEVPIFLARATRVFHARSLSLPCQSDERFVLKFFPNYKRDPLRACSTVRRVLTIRHGKLTSLLLLRTSSSLQPRATYFSTQFKDCPPPVCCV